MITLTEYWNGHDKTYPAELTNEVRGNSFITVTRANLLLNTCGMTRKLTSGWRPLAINQKTPGASRKSKHIIGAAIDIEDKDGLFYKWCWDNHNHAKDTGPLKDVGLWIELRADTPSWCHLQIIAPNSGRRFFKAF